MVDNAALLSTQAARSTHATKRRAPGGGTSSELRERAVREGRADSRESVKFIMPHLSGNGAGQPELTLNDTRERKPRAADTPNWATISVTRHVHRLIGAQGTGKTSRHLNNTHYPLIRSLEAELQCRPPNIFSEKR